MTTEPHHSRMRSSGAFAKRVLSRIEADHVTVRPRWEFLFKHYLFWIVGGVAVVIGSFAFSAAIFHIENAGWRYYAAIHPSFFRFFLETAPFLWVVVLILFIGIGYVNIRHTRRGYRYSLSTIVIGSILVSFTLGTALYAAGFGSGVEELVGDHPPFFRSIVAEQREAWLAPDEGLLGGHIVSVGPNAASFELRDFSGKAWDVDSSDVGKAGVSAIISGGIVRVVGVPAFVQGTGATTTSSVFHACFIFPWKIRGVLDQQMPHSFFVPFSTSTAGETNAVPERSDICKGIRPYQTLQTIDGATN